MTIGRLKIFILNQSFPAGDCAHLIAFLLIAKTAKSRGPIHNFSTLGHLAGLENSVGWFRQYH